MSVVDLDLIVVVQCLVRVMFFFVRVSSRRHPLDIPVYRRIVNSLMLLVLCLQSALHIKIELSLAFDALLFHVSDDALVHCGLFPFLLKVDKDDCAGGEEGCSRKGELRGTRHGGFGFFEGSERRWCRFGWQSEERCVGEI